MIEDSRSLSLPLVWHSQWPQSPGSATLPHLPTSHWFLWIARVGSPHAQVVRVLFCGSPRMLSRRDGKRRSSPGPPPPPRTSDHSALRTLSLHLMRRPPVKQSTPAQAAQRLCGRHVPRAPACSVQSPRGALVLPINFKSGNGGSDRKLTCRVHTLEHIQARSSCPAGFLLPVQPEKTGKLTTMSVFTERELHAKQTLKGFIS